MKNKETPWFSGDQKPVRDGVYKRRRSCEKKSIIYFSRFENGCWYKGCAVIGTITESASKLFALEGKIASNFQNLSWCGLAEEPKCTKKKRSAASKPN